MPSYHAGLATTGSTGSSDAEQMALEESVAVADPTQGLEPTTAALLTANPNLVVYIKVLNCSLCVYVLRTRHSRLTISLLYKSSLPLITTHIHHHHLSFYLTSLQVLKLPPLRHIHIAVIALLLARAKNIYPSSKSSTLYRQFRGANLSGSHYLNS